MSSHILFLTPWYPDKKDPMLGLFVRKQTVALSAFSRVGVISVMPSVQLKNFDYHYSVFENKIPEIRVYYRKSVFRPLNVLRTLVAYKKACRKYIRQFGKPDLIHANILTRTAIAAKKIAAKLGVPFVISEHWSRYLPENYSYRGVLRKKLTEIVVRKAKAVIVPSEQLGMAMKKAGIKGNYEIVPNVIDEKLFDLPVKKQQSEIKRIVHISCFEDRSKNISGLLKAVYLLKKNREDFELHLVGTGVDFEKMKQLTVSLGIENKIVFHGLLENEQLAEVLNNACFSVLPSHYETFGIVVYESLACGVPVVVSDVAGFGRIIEPELGRVVRPGDTLALADALNSMLDNSEKFQPEKLREFILKGYTGRIVAEKLLEIYGSSL